MGERNRGRRINDIRRAICRIKVQRLAEAVFMKGAKGKEFYIRQGNTTRSLDVEEVHRYIKLRWAA